MGVALLWAALLASLAARGRRAGSILGTLAAVLPFAMGLGVLLLMRYVLRMDVVPPQLFAQVPLAPFTGQPLQMGRRGDTLHIYRLGPDAEDNAGTPWEGEKKRGDVVFTVLME